jgi:hypothetical protein
MALSVIGAGLGRTGTTSLKLALEQLGFGPCHHMQEVGFNPVSVDLWMSVADGNRDWEAVFAGYRSAVDWPEVAFYKELIAFYPDARVILTERDPEAWFRSTQNTILSPEIRAGPPRPISILMGKLMAMFEPDAHNHDKLIAAFNAHNAEVRRIVPPGRLLIYEVADGWAPLCDFLGVPVPDGPMPHANSTDEFKAMTAGMRARAAQGQA